VDRDDRLQADIRVRTEDDLFVSVKIDAVEDGHGFPPDIFVTGFLWPGERAHGMVCRQRSGCRHQRYGQ
jgi:hypothetical protein